MTSEAYLQSSDAQASDDLMEPLQAVLVLYHLFPAHNAPTTLDHARSFEHYSRFPVVSLNTDDGFPPGLDELRFKVIVLHYSLFAGRGYFFDGRFLRYLENATGSTKIAFFQDEHHYCPQRFAFIDRYGVDVVYSLLEAPYHEQVYRSHSSATTIRSTLTGYVSDDLVARSADLLVPEDARSVDVGYRARRLDYYMGSASQEKHEIGERFREHVAHLGLRLDIATGEGSRIYGDAWYKFVAQCRGMLGVEAGVSVFDLDDTARSRTAQLLSKEPGLSFDEVERRVLHEYEGKIPYRTVSPRHFEAAAFRVVQILYEGQYSGVLEPDVHYLALAKDYSNFDDVMARFADPEIRQAMTERAYHDLIASGQYSYRAFIDDFDDHLADFGLHPGVFDEDAHRALLQRLRRRRHLRRFAARARFIRTRPFPGRRAVGATLHRAQALQTAWARTRRMFARRAPTGEPLILSVTPLAADRDSRASKIAASFGRMGYRSVLMEREPSSSLPDGSWFEVRPIRKAAVQRGGRRLPGIVRLPYRFFVDAVFRTVRRMPRADLVYLHGFYQYPAVRLRTWRRRVPLIYDAHDFYAALVPEGGLQRRLENSVERRCIRRATSFVTVSDGVASLYEQHSGRDPIVLPNAHDERLDAQHTTTLRSLAGASEADFVLAIVGQWKLYTPMRVILDALGKCDPSVFMAFLGAGYESRWHAEAAARGVEDRVAFLAPVSPWEVVPTIASADAAAVLYRPLDDNVRNCLPNGGFQALAAGLPLIYAEDLPMVVDLVGDAGLPVDADDPAAIADAIGRLHLDTGLRDRLARAARARAEHVTWKQFETQLAELVVNAIGPPPFGRPPVAQPPVRQPQRSPAELANRR